jgi:hypothetical protein
MTHFLKLCYNVFILENKIYARVFRRTCVNLCYIMLEIALICVNLERVSFLEKTSLVFNTTKNIQHGYLKNLHIFQKVCG